MCSFKMNFKRKFRQIAHMKTLLLFLCTMVLCSLTIHELAYLPKNVSRQIGIISRSVVPIIKQLEGSLTKTHWRNGPLTDNTTFVQVRGTNVFMYSAYYDDRDKDQGPVIRVLALTPKRELKLVYCIYVTDSGKRVCCGQAVKIRINPQLLNVPYPTSIAVFYLCKCENLPSKPTSMRVTLVPQSCSILMDIERFLTPEKSNELWVRVAFPSGRSSSSYSQKDQFRVCIPPVFGLTLKKLTPLLRTFESNLFFGADRIVLYNHSLPADTESFLESYISEGKVELLNWPLSRTGLLSQHQIHYHGQNLAINDCLYRNQGATHYLLITDLDELIVPRKHDTWRDLMNQLDASPGAGSFLFCHTHFDYNATNEPELYYFDEYRRSDRILTGRIRSKMMVRPDLVVSVGVHETFQLVDGFSQVVVPRDLGLLHHYNRNVPVPGPFVNDTRMTDLKNKFRTQLQKRLGLLNGIKLGQMTQKRSLSMFN